MTIDTSNRHPSTEEKLAFFECNHLPDPLFNVAYQCKLLAETTISVIPDHPQLTLGLQKLIEAKDCFVRASLAAENIREGKPEGESIHRLDVTDPNLTSVDTTE